MRDVADLDVPVLVAPMAGGPTTPELCAAVANAGGGAVLAGADRHGEDIASDLATTRALTDGLIGVNLFVPEPLADEEAARKQFARYRKHLASAYPDMTWPEFDDCRHEWSNEDQCEALHTGSPDFVSFTFGMPSPEACEAVRALGCPLYVTCADEDMIDRALALGADGVIVQGREAGGHRSTASMVDTPTQHTTRELVEAAASRGATMIIAAGGVRTRADVADMLDAGAHAVQVGTPFLATPESGLSSEGKELVKAGGGVSLTRSFSRRAAQGLTSLVVDEVIVPAIYPHLNKLTANIRAAGRARDDVSVQSVWAGDPCRGITGDRAATVLASLDPGQL